MYYDMMGFNGEQARVFFALCTPARNKSSSFSHLGFLAIFKAEGTLCQTACPILQCHFLNVTIPSIPMKEQNEGTLQDHTSAAS